MNARVYPLLLLSLILSQSWLRASEEDEEGDSDKLMLPSLVHPSPGRKYAWDWGWRTSST